VKLLELKRVEIAQRSELQAVKDWFAYNTFVRQQYLKLISGLPTVVITKDRGASFPSILDVFTHVLDVYKSWFIIYDVGKDLTKSAPVWPEEIKGLSLAEVKNLEREVDSYISKFIRTLKNKDLNTRFQYSSGKGKIVRRKLMDLLWHLVEEELQHRGEMNALLWQDDINPPITSWTKWKKMKKD
jgi:uncharacterized damage-inducible protein DinB